MTIRLLVNTTKPLGQVVAELADKLSESQAAMRRIKAAADSMTYGNPTDYAALEAELGLPAGKGADFYALLSGAATALDAAIIGEFVQRTDQG